MRQVAREEPYPSLGVARSTWRDRKRAALLALALVGAFIATAPFASIPLPAVPAFIVGYDAAILILDLATALLLYAQYRDLGERPFLALACGYLFTAILSAAHGLSFPDAFRPGSLIGDSQSTAWLWMAWHGTFPVFVMVYALRIALPAGAMLAIAILGAAGLIGIALNAGQWLPELMLGAVYRSPRTQLILGIAWLVHLTALTLLFARTRGRRVIDLWIAIMLLASLIDLALSALLVNGRYELGFYAGRVYGLVAAGTVLSLLLRNALGSQSRLGESLVALNASEARFRALFEGMGEAYYLVRIERDENGAPVDLTYIEENPAAVAMLGSSSRGERLSTLNPCFEPDWLEIVDRVSRTGKPEQFERKSSLIGRHFAFHVFRPDGPGDLVGVVSHDVTERTRAEQALRDSEERFRALAESIEDVFYMTNLEQGVLEYLSPSYERVWGRPVTELLDDLTRFPETIHPDDRGQFSLNKAAQERGEPMETEYRIVRPDGTVRWIHDRSFPVAGFEGRRSAGVATDITDRRAAEEALRASEARLRTLVTGIPQLAWRAGEPGEWTWASPQWTTFTGQSQEDSLGVGWLDPVHPEDRETVRRAWHMAEERGAFEAECRILHATEKRYRWFWSRATPVRDDGTRVVEWVGTSTDVDELRMLQQRQQLLLSELQHRVRNTLGVVKSITRRTAQSSTSVDELAAHLEGRIEAFSRVQAVVARDPSRGVSLRMLVEDELLAHATREGTHLAIRGAELMLKHRAAESISLAVHELATNAVKHGALSAPHGMVDVQWHLDGSQVRFEWKESGLDQAVAAEPTGDGFGTELLLQSLPYELDAETHLFFEPRGLRFTMSVPTDMLLAEDAIRPA